MNKINNFSLLQPEGEYDYFTLDENAINDLSLQYLIENIVDEPKEYENFRNILIKMPVDEKVIKYRQEIYQDLKNNIDVCKDFIRIFNEMKFNLLDRECVSETKSSIWDLVSRLKYLETYAGSIIELKKIFDKGNFQSEGMKKFSQAIINVYNDNGFKEFSEDMKELGEDISGIGSITLGVNLDERLSPVEVGIVSVNQGWFSQQGILERFLKFHKDNVSDDGTRGLNSYTMIAHPKVHGEVNPLMNNLTKIVEKMLSSTTSNLKNILKKYVDISGMVLINILNDIMFYSYFTELEQKVTALGLPTSIPGTSDEGSTFSDFYNIRLAIGRMKGKVENDIVCNDFEFNKNQQVVILTGPNRGGKTIFTQAIGLVHLFFQHGVFVPCRQGNIQVCDGIYTHFPADENMTMALGRLGEEAQRFKEICVRATSKSLLLFNESFATTSHTESLYIATDALRYICCLGTRTCFNTHMHELADNSEELSNSEKAVCKAVSVVMGCEGEDSYKIFFKKPDGRSYAHRIAQKYGITFEQLSERLNK